MPVFIGVQRYVPQERRSMRLSGLSLNCRTFQLFPFWFPIHCRVKVIFSGGIETRIAA